jgi:glycosyl-4,4'-diaponeurosporenoate acyltransferase
MVVELPIGWIIALNTLGWLFVQFGLAWLMTRLPAERFAAQHGFARLCDWEKSGRVYERLFRIKLWKDRLPDAASWFKGGFAKANLHKHTSAFFEQFRRETWRGELTHWLALLALPCFAIWNSGWAFGINVAYALAANLPCILVQRYNRARFRRILERNH